MNILHVASHKGNIGDLVNHQGFYQHVLKQNRKMSIEKIELRDFYFSATNQRHFDETFANEINNHELLIMGGGGFFDVQWSSSYTGTTLDFSKSFIDSIKTKVLVNAMGYHEYPGISNDAVYKKFENFLSDIGNRSNWLITVRNDGSYERIKKRYGSEIAKQIIKVPDNGFFCSQITHDEKNYSKTIGMCITNDLFSREFNKDVTPEEFNLYISTIINELCQEEYRVVMLPHTPADLNTINEVMKEVGGEYKRNQILVAPYDANSPNAIERLNEYYGLCDCIIGMRFHSVITGINKRIPTIAVAGHEQISALCNDLGLNDYCIRVDNLNFKKRLLDLIEINLKQFDKVETKYNVLYNRLNKERNEYSETIKSFMNIE